MIEGTILADFTNSFGFLPKPLPIWRLRKTKFLIVPLALYPWWASSIVDSNINNKHKSRYKLCSHIVTPDNELVQWMIHLFFHLLNNFSQQTSPNKDETSLVNRDYPALGRGWRRWLGLVCCEYCLSSSQYKMRGMAFVSNWLVWPTDRL